MFFTWFDSLMYVDYENTNNSIRTIRSLDAENASPQIAWKAFFLRRVSAIYRWKLQCLEIQIHLESELATVYIEVKTKKFIYFTRRCLIPHRKDNDEVDDVQKNLYHVMAILRPGLVSDRNFHATTGSFFILCWY